MTEQVEIWVMNKPIYSIWSPGESRPYLARHLIDPVRVVIGFWAMPGVPIRNKAEAAGLLAGEFIALNRMLLAVDNDAVEFCRRNQLPASASVSLKKPLRCNGCGALLRSLPCIFLLAGA